MLRFCCLFLTVCAFTQAEAVRVLGRRALLADFEEEDPEAEGRVFSIVRDSERDKYEQQPIIIQPPQQPPYQIPQLPPYPHHPYPHQPYPHHPHHPFPYPVHVHQTPPTIIQPIIKTSYRPHRPHGHHHGYPGPFFGGLGALNDASGLPFINITYSPVISAPAATETTSGLRNDASVLAPLQQILAQTLAQSQLQQYPARAPIASNNFVYQVQPSAQQFFDQSVAEFEDIQPVQQVPSRTQYLVRRTKKPKKKSKKNKKQTQLVYLALEPEAEVGAEAQMNEQVA